MSRLKTCFATLKRRGRTALIPFVTAGDPQPSVTVPLMHALVAAGADILELGRDAERPDFVLGCL